MIYLDNNATTTMDPRVHRAMEPIFAAGIGNPSSIHRYGQKARALLTKAKASIASFFKVRIDELVFTSGATEALNMAIRSAPRGSHIITSSLEHVSVMEPLKFTECTITYLDPEPGHGSIQVHQIEKALRSNTTMIVLTAANNETGIKTDIEAIAAFAYKIGVAFIVDGVVMLGKEPVSIPKGVSAICFSGHKIHAPTGIGLVLMRKPFKLNPLIVGGPQQQGMRGGTENLLGIVGLAKAIELIGEDLPTIRVRMEVLRDHLEKGILRGLPDVLIHGANQDRVCNTTNIAFLGVDGETLLMNLDLAGVAVSYGSACSSGALEPPRVLLNMGLSSQIAGSSIRFSLSRFTTEKEIERAVSIVIDVVTQMRNFVCAI